MGINQNKRYAIIGNKDEPERVAELLRKSDMSPGLIGLISTEEREKTTDGYIGHIDQLKEIIKIYSIDEVIFCAKDLSAHTIIDYMSGLNVAQVEYKIAPPKAFLLLEVTQLIHPGIFTLLNSIQYPSQIINAANVCWTY